MVGSVQVSFADLDTVSGLKGRRRRRGFSSSAQRRGILKFFFVDPSGRVDLSSLPAFVALPTEGRFAGVLPPVSSTKSSSSVFSTSESELES